MLELFVFCIFNLSEQEVWTVGLNRWPEVNQFKMFSDLIDCFSLSLIWALAGKFYCMFGSDVFCRINYLVFSKTNIGTWYGFHEVSECHLLAKLDPDLYRSRKKWIKNVGSRPQSLQWVVHMSTNFSGIFTGLF